MLNLGFETTMGGDGYGDCGEGVVDGDGCGVGGGSRKVRMVMQSRFANK